MTHTHPHTHTHAPTPTSAPTPTHTSIQAMDGLKQAIQANTLAALESAIKNAESVAGFNPPELRTARDMLRAAKVGSGQSWGRTRVIGHTHTHTHTSGWSQIDDPR